jgi:hypothetical protein
MDKDLVKVKLISDRYHRSNEKGSFYIPLFLFYPIVTLQTALSELHQQAGLYNKPPNDKPMRIEKNHPIVVEEGEIVHFPDKPSEIPNL